MENFSFNPGEPAHLEIFYTTEEGSEAYAQSSVIVPGAFYITNTEPSDTNEYGEIMLELGDDLSVSWSNSVGADVYDINFEWYYDYYDNQGNYQYFSSYIDTLIAGNFIGFPSDYLFPPELEISTIEWGYGDFDFYATTGPWQEGDEGNITVDGIGFFNGVFYGPDLDIQIGGYSSGSSPEPRENRLPGFIRERNAQVQLGRGNS